MTISALTYQKDTVQTFSKHINHTRRKLCHSVGLSSSKIYIFEEVEALVTLSTVDSFDLLVHSFVKRNVLNMSKTMS